MRSCNKEKQPNYSLKKSEIIREHGAIQKLIQTGLKSSGKHICIFYGKGENSKVAFIVSKKFKRAANRNHIRRFLREIYRKNKEKFGNGLWLLYCKHSNEILLYRKLQADTLAEIRKIKNNG